MTTMPRGAAGRPLELAVTLGLPGSGKTTRALEWLAQGTPDRPRMRSNRDELRSMMFNAGGLLPAWQEDLVTQVQHEQIRMALSRWCSVIVDDTNLRQERRHALERMSIDHLAHIAYIDLRDVPVEQCIANDARRAAARVPGRGVGADVIRAMAAQYGLPR